MATKFKYVLWSDKEQREIGYASNKPDAIELAKAISRNHGSITVATVKTGDIIFETH